MESLEWGKAIAGGDCVPRGGFGIGTVKAMRGPPAEWLPRCLCRCKVGVDIECAVGVVPRRCGVKRRGSVNGRRVG